MGFRGLGIWGRYLWEMRKKGALEGEGKGKGIW